MPFLLLSSSIAGSGCHLTHDPLISDDASRPPIDSGTIYTDARPPIDSGTIHSDARPPIDAGTICRGDPVRPSRACVGGELGHLLAGEAASLELALDGCFCAEVLTCAAVASPGAIDLEVELCPSPADCVECVPHLDVRCAIPALPEGRYVVRVNGSEVFDVEARLDTGESGTQRCFAVAPAPDGALICDWPGFFRSAGLTECHPSSSPAWETVPVRFVDPCPSCFDIDAPCEIRWDDSNEIVLRPQSRRCDCPVCGACADVCTPRERTCTLPPLPAGRYFIRVEGASGATAIDIGPSAGPEVCTVLPG